MFLISKKHKTPISTYTDSYRPPCSVKKTIQDQGPQQLWKENKFVTQGLTMPLVQNPSSQGQSEQLIKVAMQEYYRNTIDPAAYWPEKYWPTRSKEKYSPVFVNEVKYITWKTGPYNSAAWNKHSTYLPLLPKETRMDTFLHSTLMPYPAKPTCLNQSEREVVADMYMVPVYTMTGRGPFQGYYSPYSGRYYCLRRMDGYDDEAPAIRRHLHERAEYSMLQLQPQSNVLCIYTWPPAILPVQEP
ncbi:Spermatid-specific manchette-related protein 1 [Pelecanus crispus]|uniref:Spermatid-specific manchette-related protein 1 n=1 Tax=Pelecanus crispus TaxID=36300 RepID=A0A091TTL7_PELCR|nr:PREDICTED: spermatid-specific manchette-related protein 1 [Pelecanus crispus]KFQ62001.1 Spermatid-specific manchette-related protein 1 [Pelecanus crispus]